MGKEALADNLEFTAFLRDPASVTGRLLSVWGYVPLLLMQEGDWNRKPLVLIGESDVMMWPLLPPGTLLELDQSVKAVQSGSWSEFDRPVYLIEYKTSFYCCHAQRQGRTLLLISHPESPSPPATAVPGRDAKVRGRLTPVFRPLLRVPGAPAASGSDE